MNAPDLLQTPLPALPTLTIAPEAEQKREALIAQSAGFTVARTVTDANSIGEAARDIRTHIKAVREAGMSLRRPLKAAADKIKAIEDAYVSPLEAEQRRLEGVAGAWHAAEAKRVAEEQRARQAEIERLAREEAAARELAAAGGAEAVEAAKLETAASAEWETAVRAPLPEAAKIGGMTTRKVMRVEVVDIASLYAARPDLVKLEPKLAAIKATCFPEHPVPGLRLWWENETVTKAW